MARFQEAVEVNVPASVAYQQWMKFENFPMWMKHVKQIVRQGENRFHWVVKGPLGKDLEWDAEIDGHEPNRMISWHSVSKPDVGVQGAVLFEELGSSRSRIIATLQYEPPAGPLGEAVAAVFSNPQKMVQEELQNFKGIVESKMTSPSQRNY